MPYDDIRFSMWDDPDDDADDDFDDDNMTDADGDFDYYEDAWDHIPMDYGGECNMCGKESNTNTEGYCPSCWQVWNS